MGPYRLTEAAEAGVKAEPSGRVESLDIRNGYSPISFHLCNLHFNDN